MIRNKLYTTKVILWNFTVCVKSNEKSYKERQRFKGGDYNHECSRQFS